MGLAGDRRWLLVDTGFRFVSQREHASLARLMVGYGPGNDITVATDGAVAKPCGRCVVTTTDQITGERGTQPLRILAAKRRFGRSLVFGQNIIPDSAGLIRAGDPVEIMEYVR